MMHSKNEVFDKLREIHPDLLEISIDTHDIKAVFEDVTMERSEFVYGSPTRTLLDAWLYLHINE